MHGATPSCTSLSHFQLSALFEAFNSAVASHQLVWLCSKPILTHTVGSVHVVEFPVFGCDCCTVFRMDGNVDSEVCFPCPRCGVHINRNDGKHNARCGAAFNMGKVHIDKQTLSFEELCEPCDVSKRRIHEAREVL